MLKVKGKYREVFHPIKNSMVWSEYPTSREDAREEGVARYYIPGYRCPNGCEGEPTFFTLTGIRSCCANKQATTDYNTALHTGVPVSISSARQQGTDFYWSTPQINSYCGHSSKVTLAGKCWFCAQERGESPRKLAVAAGATWYTPREDDPCPRGHVGARRRVSNGSCEACEQEGRTARGEDAPAVAASADPPINVIAPDLILARKTARELGFKVYRTGEPCKNGHTGWRYVSTGGCLVCLGRSK